MIYFCHCFFLSLSLSLSSSFFVAVLSGSRKTFISFMRQNPHRRRCHKKSCKIMQKGLKQLQEVQKSRHVLITLDKKNYQEFYYTQVWWARREIYIVVYIEEFSLSFFRSLPTVSKSCYFLWRQPARPSPTDHDTWPRINLKSEIWNRQNFAHNSAQTRNLTQSRRVTEIRNTIRSQKCPAARYHL